MIQQRKKNPWEKRMLPPPVPKKKNRKVLWPVTISGVIVGFIILLLVIAFIANAQGKSTPASPPSATQGLEQYLLQVAQKSEPVGRLTKSQYDANAKSLHVFDSLGIQTDKTSIKATIEHDCFVIQRAIWQSNVLLDTVEVLISATDIDLQGKLKTGAAGLCKLTEKTAHSFNWDNLSIHQAWITYDKIWTAPSLNQ